MQLPALIRVYVDEHEFGVSDGHRQQLGYAVAIFSTWLGREATTQDFDRRTVNRYVDYLRSKYRPDTVRTQRGNLLLLWRYALQEGIVESSPEGVRRQRVAYRRPTAWTPGEVARIAQEAGRIPGRFRDTPIRRGPNVRSLVLAAWDTGLRLGDLLRLSPADVSHRIVSVVQQKTGWPVRRELTEITWLACACTVADSPDRSAVWPLRAKCYQDWIHRIVQRLPVRPGSLKWIRRAVATAAEAAEPGGGTRMLGHLDPRTARWYLDRDQLDQPYCPPPLPPAEGGG